MTEFQNNRSRGIRAALQRKSNVTKAVMLRDMRSRFFNHGLGFLMVPLWPLAHMGIIMALYTMAGRTTPFGSSLLIYFGTGLLPTLSFMYISRFTALSLLNNKNMTKFPIVRPADILHGRAALEIIGSCMMAAMMFVALLALGDNPYPADPGAAVAALSTAMAIAVGMGMMIGCIAVVAPIMMTVYILFTILIYVLSGTIFVVSVLPAQLVYALSWNPILHCVEWMRIAFIPGYPGQVVDRAYAVGFALGSMFFGLLIERIMRPLVLSS